MFGAPHFVLHDIHGGPSGRGKWGRPDVVVACYKSRESSRHFRLHSIEYEKKGGFSPSNVAQAYVSGRGAYMCWLLFDFNDWPNVKQLAKNPNAQITKEVAEKLGVGLIRYKSLNRSHSWKVLVKAKPQRPKEKYKLELKHLISRDVKKYKEKEKNRKRKKSRLKKY